MESMLGTPSNASTNCSALSPICNYGREEVLRSSQLTASSYIPQKRCDVTAHSCIVNRALIGNAIGSLLCERIDFYQHLDFWRPSCFSSHATSTLSMKTEAWSERSETRVEQEFPTPSSPSQTTRRQSPLRPQPALKATMKSRPSTWASTPSQQLHPALRMQSPITSPSRSAGASAST